MPLVQHAFESITGRQSTAPRTILGFFLGLFTVAVSGAVGATFALADSEWDGLIPFIWAFVGLITVLLGVAVFVIAWKDPSKLMLGQISGHDYLAIRRLTLGDSSVGERRDVLDRQVAIQESVGNERTLREPESGSLDEGES